MKVILTVESGPRKGERKTFDEPDLFTVGRQENCHFYLVDDPERIASMMGSKQGEKAFAVMISRNPGKFRQLLGVS